MDKPDIPRTRRVHCQGYSLRATSVDDPIDRLGRRSSFIDHRLGERKWKYGGKVMAVVPLRPSNRTALHGLGIAMFAGFLVIILCALSSSTVQQFLRLTSIGLLLAGAFGLLGGLIGFLFGIPRSLQAPEGVPPGPAAPGSAAGSAREPAITYHPNTNLEQISDWLTKILVGVGLTQLTALPRYLKVLAAYLAPGFGPIEHPELLAIAIALYFSISGFLFGYLWTRLFLGGALREADLASLGEKLSELQRQIADDATALNLVQQQLNPLSDSAEVPIEELRNAIFKASPSAKTSIYYQAADVRTRNWRDIRTKPRMERTIPIFRALTESGTRDEFHGDFGQLGFALHDKREPEWSEAAKALSKAIDIRGDWRVQPASLYYEFVRALCRIHLDTPSESLKADSSSYRPQIVADLQAASSNADIYAKMESELLIKDWLAKNHLSAQVLHS
jgi:hypothetical protein